MNSETPESSSRLSGWLTLIGVVLIGTCVLWLMVAGGKTLLRRMQLESEWQALTAPIREKGGGVAWWTEYDPDEVSDAGDIAAAVSWRNSTADDDDVRYIAVTFRKIYGLHLDGTRVTDEGLEHLYGLKSLTRVTLNNTQVTQQGVADLQAALPDCSIECRNPLPNE